MKLSQLYCDFQIKPLETFIRYLEIETLKYKNKNIENWIKKSNRELLLKYRELEKILKEENK